MKEEEYDTASETAKAIFKPYRLSDNTVVGTAEEIDSNVKLPETRIQSIPETGSESSSGNLECEWNIDEQDDLLASVMCSKWENGESEKSTSTTYEPAKTQPANDDDIINGDYYIKSGSSYEKVESYDSSVTYYVKKTSESVSKDVKTLSLGTSRDVYYMLKKYNQEPKAYELYTGIQIDQLQLTLALNAFATMSWAVLGANNPAPVLDDPTVNAEYGEALTTKSFITRELVMNIKDYTTGEVPDWTFTKEEQMRQCPNFELTISNNKERTDALGETEAIEMADGDFVVEGTFECWNADKKAINIKADAIKGKDKLIEVSVYRTVAGVKTAYTIRIVAHLKTPSESRDGNKLKYSIPFSMNTKNGLQFVKTVENVA